MATSLKQNLSSAYLDAARRLSPRKERQRIVAYVESYDDIAFWRTLLAEFEDEQHYFQIMLPSSKSLARGKKMALANIFKPGQLGRSLIACVDSDYDFLFQGATELSHHINSSPYVLQTYSYAIENYHCYAESLHEICVQSTLNDRQLIDFPAFMRRYSEIIYPLFLWNIWFYRRRDTNTFPMYEFHDATRLNEINVHRPEEALQAVERNVAHKLKELRRRFPQWTGSVEKLGHDLEHLQLKPETTYLYIQGHHLMDGVVMKLLIPVCTQLRREREAEIKRLANHEEQFHNELTCYENSLVSPAVMLKKNDRYKELYLYQWMREDVRDFMNNHINSPKTQHSGNTQTNR